METPAAPAAPPQPPTPPAADPVAREARTLIEAYHVDDGTPEPADEAPAAEPKRPVPPKDPVTGKFVSPVEPAAAEPATHPAWLVEQALDLGLTEDDISRTPTDVLGKTVAQTSRLLRRETRQERRFEMAQEGKNGFHQDQPQNGAVREAAGEPFWGTDPETHQPINPKEFDVGVQRLMERVETQDAEIKTLKAMVQQLTSFEGQRQQQTVAERIDAFFDAQQNQLFGEGPGSGLGDTPEYSRRHAVLTEAQRLAGPRATVPQMLAKLSEATRNLFGPPRQPQGRDAAGQRQQTPQRPQKAQKANGRYEEFEPDADADPRMVEWEKAGLSAPTQRRGGRKDERPLGRQRAEESVRQKMREQGAEEGDWGDVGADDFLP